MGAILRGGETQHQRAEEALTPRIRALTAVLAATLALPLVTAAQPRKVPRIGYLLQPPLSETPSLERAAFLETLRGLGYVEGQTIVIEYRSAGGNAELFPELVGELVRLNVDVIVTVGASLAPHAAKKATATIPIVMAGIGDAVGTGLVASLARPGGNVTGVSHISPELSAKRLQLLKEAVPAIRRVAVLWNPDGPSGVVEWRATQAAARQLGLTLQSHEIRHADDVVRSFAAMSLERPDALTMFFDTQTGGYRELVADFAKKNRLPTIFGWSEFVTAGGLMSYAANTPELFKRAAVYVDRILRGTRPADLPVEQPTRLELIVNLRTARAIGLALPLTLLLRADRVIE